MNPLNALIVKKLNDKLDQLHQDNLRIVSLLENIAEKEKVVIKIQETRIKVPKTFPLSQFDKDLWSLF